MMAILRIVWVTSAGVPSIEFGSRGPQVSGLVWFDARSVGARRWTAQAHSAAVFSLAGSPAAPPAYGN